MSVNSVIKTVLADVASVIEPDIYTGTETEYITFNYFSTGENFADDEPKNELYQVQVHYCCPADTNSLTKRGQIKRRLLAADFTWPTVTDATDEDGQHWIFECEYLMEAETDGI